MVIDDKEYKINPLSQKSYDYFLMITKHWARKDSRNIDDFYNKIKNYPVEDKKLLMSAYFAGDWERVSEYDLRKMQSSLAGVRLLASLKLEPKPDPSYITEVNKNEIYRQLLLPVDPIDIILESNKSLRERINASSQ